MFRRAYPLILGVLFLAAASAWAADPKRNLTVAPGTPAAASEARIALVIGNSNYKSAPLRNPVNDAKAIADKLQGLGFKVTLKLDQDQKSMAEAIRVFGNQLKAGGAGLFYYAGHGMQVRGRNFLIPVDADIQNEDEVPYRSVDANEVLSKMETAKNRLNLMILDACRNNPFSRKFRSSSQGLAQMDAPSGTLVAFATAPGVGGERRHRQERHLHPAPAREPRAAGRAGRATLQARARGRDEGHAQRPGAVGGVLARGRFLLQARRGLGHRRSRRHRAGLLGQHQGQPERPTTTRRI